MHEDFPLQHVATFTTWSAVPGRAQNRLLWEYQLAWEISDITISWKATMPFYVLEI